LQPGGTTSRLEAKPIEPPRRVLLVESSRSERSRLRGELLAAQLEVHEASDLITAAQAVPIVQPNLILAQMRLPTHSGMELVRRLKEDRATYWIPVILYSDITSPEERVRALDLGAVDVLSKPFVSAELVARVRAALRTRHALTVLERRAHLDGLTGLANRGVLEDQLQREWDSCRRRGVPLTVMIVDLDHFKSINDRFGHATGDEVLRRTAKVLAQSVRSSDLVARYGGEEFVVVAPNCPLAAAKSLAKRFRAELARVAISEQSTAVVVTASVGIAGAVDFKQSTPIGLLHQADQALYQAKRSGRDAIWAYDPSRGAPTVVVASGTSADPSVFRL
jgi:diguanylate cyclase (GGDEF)-like protein